MSYRFKAKESVPDGIRRIVREEVEDATKGLTGGTADRGKRDEAIHEARKSIKKIRGALRLLQTELGQIYKQENQRLGETGRQLSELRDAEAIIEVFDGVVEKYRQQLKPEAARAIRRGLLKNKQETERRANVAVVVRRAVATLRSVGKKVDEWPLKSDGFQALAPGFKRRYRRGQQAMTQARKRATPESFHEWRKRVKDHWYHVRLLESLWTEVLQARENSLKELETWLGDDHNLVVLCEKLDGSPEQYGGDDNVELFKTILGNYSAELRDKSLSLGERVYEQKPKLLIAEMSRLWDAWQNEPASMKDAQKEERAQKKSPGQVKAKRAVA